MSWPKALLLLALAWFGVSQFGNGGGWLILLAFLLV